MKYEWKFWGLDANTFQGRKKALPRTGQTGTSGERTWGQEQTEKMGFLLLVTENL